MRYSKTNCNKKLHPRLQAEKRVQNCLLLNAMRNAGGQTFSILNEFLLDNHFHLLDKSGFSMR